MTYLIVEKQEKTFDLHWVNRPNVSLKKELNTNATLSEIRSLLDKRFPFMDMKKLLKYPFKTERPTLSDAIMSSQLPNQGNETNCVVSNIFAMLETVDKLNVEVETLDLLRNSEVRRTLMKDYSFYKNDFYSFDDTSTNYSLESIWEKIERSYEDNPFDCI